MFHTGFISCLSWLLLNDLENMFYFLSYMRNLSLPWRQNTQNRSLGSLIVSPKSYAYLIFTLLQSFLEYGGCNIEGKKISKNHFSWYSQSNESLLWQTSILYFQTNRLFFFLQFKCCLCPDTTRLVCIQQMWLEFWPQIAWSAHALHCCFHSYSGNFLLCSLSMCVSLSLSLSLSCPPCPQAWVISRCN